MRKIIVAEFVSLNGVIHGPGPEEDTKNGPLPDNRKPVGSHQLEPAVDILHTNRSVGSDS
jgi:hypothetical protein